MQKIRIDFDNPGLQQHISAVENDSQSRFFQAMLYENGKAYTAPEGATYSIMYRGFGPQNQGWYDTINDGAGKRAACAVSGNVVTCEIARQALQVPGHVSIVLCVTTGKGYMLKSWPIECDCKNDRYDSTTEIESFFYVTSVSNASWMQAIQAVEELKNTIDPTLSLSGKAADAKATGDAVGQLKEDVGDRNIALVFQYEGYINNVGELEFVNAPGVFNTTDFIEVSSAITAKGKLRKIDSDHYYVNCYDINKNFIGGVLSGIGNGTDMDINGTINLLDNTCFIRITTASDSVNMIKMQYYLLDTHTESKLIQKMEKLNEDTHNSFDMNDGLGFTVFSKFASIGDSLSVGYHTEKDGTPISKDLTHSWGAYIEKRTGAKSFWTGASGETCKSWLQTTSDTWGLNYCKSIGTMPLYVICMGANETSIPIGTTSDIGTDSDTLYSYVSKVVKELRLISPNSFIVCTGVSRKQNSPDINNVYKTICELNEKCYYLDCFEEFNSGAFTSYYFNSHYSANGYSVMANLFDHKLKQVMAKNVEDFKYINEVDN